MGVYTWCHLVDTRAQRGLTEKLYQVTPRVYAQAPATLVLEQDQNTFSFSRLVNILAYALTTLARIRTLAKPKQKIATLALDAQLHFASPAQRKAFTEDLLDAIETVVHKHQQTPSDSSRSFRLVVGAFPDLSAAVQSQSSTQDQT